MPLARRSGSRDRRSAFGSATVDFVLVTLLLLPLVLGIMHLALVLHVRNTLAAAAAEGARYAATIDRGPAAGARQTRLQISQALADRYARDVTARATRRGGVAIVEVRAQARIPALGLLGPATNVEVVGRALQEQVP